MCYMMIGARHRHLWCWKTSHSKPVKFKKAHLIFDAEACFSPSFSFWLLLSPSPINIIITVLLCHLFIVSKIRVVNHSTQSNKKQQRLENKLWSDPFNDQWFTWACTWGNSTKSCRWSVAWHVVHGVWNMCMLALTVKGARTSLALQ